MILLGLILGNVAGLVLGAAYCVFVLTILFTLTLPGAVTAFLLAAGSAAPFIGPFAPLLNFLSFVAGGLALLSLGPVIVAFILILIVHFVLTALPYLLARAGMGAAITGVTQGPIPDNGRQAFGRGWLIGMSAGVNLVLLVWICGPMLPTTVIAGLAWAVVIIVLFPVFAWILNNLAASLFLSRSAIYQGFLGWFAWLLPMAWPQTLFGLFLMLTNRILATLGVPTVVVPGIGTFNPAMGPMRFDWRTGTIVNQGGFFPPTPTAANNGNIVFVNITLTDFPDSPGNRTIPAALWHETGHTLDIGANGWIFACVTYIETTFFAGGAGTYGERTAESHLRVGPGATTTRPYVPVWGLAMNTAPVATASASPSNPPAGAMVTLTGTFSDAESATGTFFWDLTRVPATTTLTIPFFANPNTANVTFTPDVGGGIYIATLIVNDGRQNSPGATVTVTVQ